MLSLTQLAGSDAIEGASILQTGSHEACNKSILGIGLVTRQFLTSEFQFTVTGHDTNEFVA